MTEGDEGWTSTREVGRRGGALAWTPSGGRVRRVGARSGHATLQREAPGRRPGGGRESSSGWRRRRRCRSTWGGRDRRGQGGRRSRRRSSRRRCRRPRQRPGRPCRGRRAGGGRRSRWCRVSSCSDRSLVCPVRQRSEAYAAGGGSAHEDPPGLTDQQRRQTRLVWEYHQMRHELRACDAAVALGSHDLGVPAYSAELFRAGLFPTLVFSGRPNPAHLPDGRATLIRDARQVNPKRSPARPGGARSSAAAGSRSAAGGSQRPADLAAVAGATTRLVAPASRDPPTQKPPPANRRGLLRIAR